jgi:hypothetical protein
VIGEVLPLSAREMLVFQPFTGKPLLGTSAGDNVWLFQDSLRKEKKREKLEKMQLLKINGLELPTAHELLKFQQNLYQKWQLLTYPQGYARARVFKKIFFLF